jgi:hypothetical protein
MPRQTRKVEYTVTMGQTWGEKKQQDNQEDNVVARKRRGAYRPDRTVIDWDRAIAHLQCIFEELDQKNR